MSTFEELCIAAEISAAEVEKLAKQLQRAAAALKRAAREGHPGKIRQAAIQIDDAAASTRQISNTADRVWPLSDSDLGELLKGASTISTPRGYPMTMPSDACEFRRVRHC